MAALAHNVQKMVRWLSSGYRSAWSGVARRRRGPGRRAPHR